MARNASAVFISPQSVQVLPLAGYVTPSTILEFDRVHQARALVLSAVYELDTLRDIACALGLLRDPTGLRPDLLAIHDRSELTLEAAALAAPGRLEDVARPRLEMMRPGKDQEAVLP